MADSNFDLKNGGGLGPDSASTALAAPSEPGASEAPADSVTKDELLDLVRAIKFAKPDASQSQVHKEITQVLSKKENGKFAFLETVQVNDVKKVWKKALQQNATKDQSKAARAGDAIGETKVPEDNADLIEKLVLHDKPPEVFTVGNNNSIAWLTHSYTAAKLASDQQAAAAGDQAESSGVDAMELAQNYVHVFLDVPMDKSGSRPHQALINFQKPSTTAPSSSLTNSAKNSTNSKKSGKKNKNNKKTSIKAALSTPSTAATVDEQGREIVKIQRALDPDSPTTKHPLLLYNQSRTHKTFIHPGNSNSSTERSNVDDTVDAAITADDYDRIVEWILRAGETGALGSAGGTKAYFYARLTETSGTTAPNILSIDVTELAPLQPW